MGDGRPTRDAGSLAQNRFPRGAALSRPAASVPDATAGRRLPAHASDFLEESTGRCGKICHHGSGGLRKRLYLR
jgi:hypothetical protein